MKVLISVDMEGVAGVTGAKEVSPGNPEYDRFRRLMTEEANQAVAGAAAAGADVIWVNDSHDGMRNVLYEALDERAELISGFNKPLCMMEGVQDADAVVCIGYHAWAGTERAILDHTISGSEIHNWWLNGERVGETQINAALAGHYGAPIVFVAGDDKLAQQVEATLPGTRTLVVKYGLDAFTARSRPLAAVRREIRAGVEAAVRGRASVAARKVVGPVTFQMEFRLAAHAEAACLLPIVGRVDARTVRVTADDAVTAWRLAEAARRLASTAAR
jgi:D-amino peptidase